MHPAPRLKRFGFHLFIPGIVLTLLTIRAAEVPAPPVAIPAPAQILETLKKEHPRLLMSSNDFERLKRRIQSDEPLRTWHARLQIEARSILAAPPSKYEIPDGLRLLDTSRRVLDRVQKMAFLYRIDGDKQYADRAWLELDAAAHFKDWNPRHFLDT